MFIGHYGPSFVGKVAKPAIPLWVLFLSVQLVDIAWSILVLLGIEKLRIVPGFTATNPLDLYYMPFTHSLPGAALWSVGAALVYRAIWRSQGWLASAIVGAAVFSHWILDLVVHRPDLALFDDSYKVGLGLWNYPAIAFALEIACTLALPPYIVARYPRLQPLRYLHSCSGCFRLERLPGGLSCSAGSVQMVVQLSFSSRRTTCACASLKAK